MAAPETICGLSPHIEWFADLIDEELFAQEEEVAPTEETVEELCSELLDKAGSVYQVYLDDAFAPHSGLTERSCARVALVALRIARLARAVR